MNKKIPAAALAALLLFLSACEETTVETSTPEPIPSAIASVGPDDPIGPEATPTPVADDGTRYFFYNGQFLGSWSEDGWRSAETEPFTIAEIFNRIYYDFWGEPLGAARFGIGAGSFNATFDGVERTDLLEPFGVIEGDDFVMKLPGQFTGEAAQVQAPDYNFFANFDGQTHVMVSNVPLERPEMSLTSLDFSPEEVTAALESVGIYYKDPARATSTTWLCDMDGDGEQEYLELIQTPRNENGYCDLKQGDPIFYAFLLWDEDQINAVASRFFPYTDDLTVQFWADNVEFYDLDGDGICELLFQDHGWEWGDFSAHSLVDGAWTQVLCGAYGM